MDALAAQARERPGAPALLGAEPLSYAALDERVETLARGLVAAGVAPGEPVALVARPRPEALVAVHAIARAGASLAPVHPSWTDEEAVRFLDAVRPRLVLAGAGCTDQARRVVQAPPLVLLSGGGSARALAASDLPPSEATLPGPAEIAALVATSGTAGLARVARLPRAGLDHVTRASASRLGLRPDDTWLASLQLAHVGGIALVLRAALTGAAVRPLERFDAAAVAGLAEEGAFTHAALVPTMLHDLLRERGGAEAPAGLRCLLVGGAGAAPSLVEEATRLGYPIALTYGLTEASSQVATAPVHEVARDPTRVGPPLRGVSVRLSDEGEVLVAGPTVFSGYLDGQGPVRDGWLHTGDLGELGADGTLRITGRLSARIISGGVNVDPSEVEAALVTHPGVAEAGVVGVPDPRWGERVVAGVVAREDGAVDAEGLAAFLAGRLAPAKRPRAYAFLTELPRNANGKLDRAALAERFG